ncbi:MAG: PilZ domain-containing protein [Nitrospira sp.]|nr:PilZ domain-containing protein [Nitrospira sp.]
MVVRKHPRFHASFSGTVIHQKRHHAISQSMDLSKRGCRVQSAFQAFAGMKVDLQLSFSDSQAPMLIQGAIVRWAGSQGIGIEFPTLTPPYQQQLDGTIQQLEARTARGPQQRPVGIRI